MFDPPNDVSEWGDKPLAGAYPPGTKLTIAGETVDYDELCRKEEAAQARADDQVAKILGRRPGDHDA